MKLTLLILVASSLFAQVRNPFSAKTPQVSAPTQNEILKAQLLVQDATPPFQKAQALLNQAIQKAQAECGSAFVPNQTPDRVVTCVPKPPSAPAKK